MTMRAGPIARVERCGGTSAVELIVFDVAVRSYEMGDRPRVELMARQINERARQWSADVFDLGYAWRGQLLGQNLEDSRAVGRTLQSNLFLIAGITIDTAEWNSFTDADSAIVEAKKRIKAAINQDKEST